MRSTRLAILLLCTTAALFSTQKAYENVPDKCPLKIKTPELQGRETAKIRLKNGMGVYLISDPNADQSAASIAVEAGSWSDPKAFPGMAHFLEHMLFLGNKKYPDEEGFMGFIRENGGLVNAYTATDRTVYMFSVTNSKFDEALDRFSHFFIDPLFMTSGIERELHAVDEEHSKNLEHDGWRGWMVFKETGNPNHPNSKFSTGTAETLRKIPRQELIRFYEKHYSANQMHLVVYSNQSLDELKKLVVQDFSPVKNRNNKSLPAYDSIMSKQQKGKMIYIEPIRDLRSITLSWELPKIYAIDKETRAAGLVAYALNIGNENGLLEHLKREKLAEGLTAGITRLSPEHLIFEIDVQLTKKGVHELNTVIREVFGTINLYKEMGLPPYLFDESQTMTKLGYSYQTREAPFNVVSDHSAGMIYEPLETYPFKSILASSYHPNRIHDLLGELTPQNCVFFVNAPESLTGIKPEKTEKWIGSEYAIHPIANNYLTQWQNSAPPHGVTLPRPNSFIPEDLDVYTTNIPEEETPTPSLLERDESGVAYFWEDSRYHVPEVAWVWSMKSPVIDGTPRSAVLTSLYTRALVEQMRPTIDEANRGGINMRMGTSNLKLYLKIEGYSEKAPLLLFKTLENMKSLHLSEEKFDLYKESHLSYYDSKTKVLPMFKGVETVNRILFSNSVTSRELYDELKALRYEDFLAFGDKLFKQVYYEVMLSGNMQYTVAKELYKEIKQTIAAEVYPESEQHKVQVFVLDNKSGPYEIQEASPMMGNGVVLSIEEGEMTLRKKAAQMILSNGMGHDFFVNLRTKQQTAYIAKINTLDVEDQLFQFFMVESSNHPPKELLYRFEQFLEAYVLDFNGAFPESRFEEIRSSLIEQLKQPPRNVSEMNSYLYNLAFDRDGNFNFKNELITTLSFLTYDNVKNYAKEFFSRDNKRRIAVLVRGSAENPHFHYLPITINSLKQSGQYITSSKD